ncbi:MAG: aconitate hydratase AcnA [Phycisphaerae bacterium]
MPTSTKSNPFGARSTISTPAGDFWMYRLSALPDAGVADVERLPRSIKVLLECALRNADGATIKEDEVVTIASWDPCDRSLREVPFLPARVLMQDFTGVPAVVDLASMRDAMVELGGDPGRINPQVPVDLVIDHSVQVDAYGSAEAVAINMQWEFARNRDRYRFLRWGQNAFKGLRVIPPGVGIVHQVNLEYLASVVATREMAGKRVAFPDSLIGTDSHTTMVNGLGVVAWGVGGIEAEAVMLGQPLYLLLPEVIGFRLVGRLREGATATDLVLTITEMLRGKGVVGRFVEFFGSGLSDMSLPDRATVANMSPEYGATMGFFPVDTETLLYLRRTARSEELIDLVERYTKEQGLFRTDASPEPEFTGTLTLDLGDVEPSLAGPKRPQDRIALSRLKSSFEAALRAPLSERGFSLEQEALDRSVRVEINGESENLTHGSVVIASITSCTNTSNPSVMIAAGLLAEKACALGLAAKPWVKTSLAPGSRVVTDYLDAAGLTPYLERLGFYTVGYGCMTCIGNSGPLPAPVADALAGGELVAVSILSGNRNFEGRIHAAVKANYLASPPLVVAYAIAGTTNIDLKTEPLAIAPNGKEVFLKDIWPTQAEIAEVMARCVTPEQFEQRYRTTVVGSEEWDGIGGASGKTYAWDPANTYVQKPPFFEGLPAQAQPIAPITGARVLVMVGDSVTTDHISPAGSFKPGTPAGRYLQELGVEPGDFNTYGSRRGNDRVMTRGTFANVRLRNLLAPGTEGGVTIHLPSGERMPIFEAARRYRAESTPLLVLAGKEYGTGSSRDWAAKGTLLLGVRVVIAESFERIHRSNLVGMGVLPLQFKDGQTYESLGITGREVFDFVGLTDDLTTRQDIDVRLTDPTNGAARTITLTARIDSPIEVDYYRNGGILPTVLRKLAAS